MLFLIGSGTFRLLTIEHAQDKCEEVHHVYLNVRTPLFVLTTWPLLTMLLVTYDCK